MWGGAEGGDEQAAEGSDVAVLENNGNIRVLKEWRGAGLCEGPSEGPSEGRQRAVEEEHGATPTQTLTGSSALLRPSSPSYSPLGHARLMHPVLFLKASIFSV